MKDIRHCHLMRTLTLHTLSLFFCMDFSVKLTLQCEIETISEKYNLDDEKKNKRRRKL